MREISTKNKILAAARKLFVEHGYAGTSIGKIAKLAGVNHSLVFHHFQNKEQLWLAVKENIVMEAGPQNEALPDSKLLLPDFLNQVFINCIRFYQDNPDLIQMFNWQRIEHDVSKNIGISKSDDMEKWIDAFKHYQSRGDINASLKPEFIITMLLGIISSAALDPNVYLIEQRAQDEYREFIVQGMMKLLK